ncbi:Centrosomal protein [Amphibalanus amphitrite]|uniref:Centrosomal protein n=1 Tax=Amphibalanus amphitrite TaxID=1232801 RepID=A0A6A4WP73_AMPAM|nr:Centrosomal protein [Amphibalanus amphitrite]
MEVPSISEVLSMELSTELSEDQLELLHSGLDGLNQQTVDGADSTQLRELLLRAQYVMRYKHAQLAVAMEEIEKLGEATGENEQLKKRNADLQHLVNTIKSKGTDSGSASVRSELEDLQASRAQLKKDLKTKQRQLDDEKRENDKLSARVEELESERRELRRQLDQLNSTLEGMRPDYDSRSDPEDAGENQYAELLRQKNHYINVLLDDVEAHEREKSELRDQVTSLREQLSEATSQIETMTAEFDQLRRKPRPAEHESAAAVGAGDPPTDRAVQRLQAEVAELRALKTRRDAQFDQLAAVVEERTDQFKRLIAQRHAEIEELQSQLRRASNRAADQTRLAELERLCADQRRQLAARQAELQRATADMEAIAARLETERRAGAADTDTGGGDAAAVVPGDSLLKVRSELSRSEAQVRQLTDRLERTEQQAAEYNDQVTQLTARLREVMEGEFGLSEAVAEIKEAQRQIGVRDRQVTEQNNFINLMQRHLTEVVDENSALRSRLGMEPHEAAELVAAGSGGREKLVHVLEREVQKLEEERIALKLENRKLSRQLRSENQSGLSPEEIRDICRQRKQFWEYVRRLGPASVPAERRPRPAAELLQRITQLESQLSESRERLVQTESAGARAAAENHQLRTGLREVLESVRQQDAVSSVKVAAPTLEALLQALDTRSLAGGEYRPALVPYSALQQLEGRNEELRDQLRAARAESRSWSVVPAASGGSGTGGVAEALAPAGLRLPAHLSVSSSQLVGQLTAQLTVALKAVDDAGRESQQTRSELEQLRAQLLVCRHQLGLLHERRAADAETWRQERGELVTARQEAETETEALQAQVEQLQLQRPAADTERQLALTVAQLVRAERRLRLTAADRDQLEQRLTAARSELQRAQRAATDTVAELRAGKRTLELQLAALQRQLARSVPLDKLTELNEQVDQLTDKYTTFLQNQEKLLGEERASRLLESELALLRQRLAGLGPTGSQQQAADTDQAQLGEQLPSEERRQRLRAEHAERLQQLLKDQLSEAERRAAELERTYTELADAGGTGRRALEQLCRRLSESAAAGAGPAEPSEAQLQAKLASVEAERDRLRETEQLATAQLEQLRSQQQAADRAADSVRRQLAELQETDDLRGVIV